MLENDSDVSVFLAEAKRDQVPTEENSTKAEENPEDEDDQFSDGSIKSEESSQLPNESIQSSYDENQPQNEVIKRLSEAIQILNASNQSLNKTNKKQLALVRSLQKNIMTQILIIQSQNRMMQSFNESKFTFVFRLLSCAWSGFKRFFGCFKFTRERRRPTTSSSRVI